MVYLVSAELLARMIFTSRACVVHPAGPTVTLCLSVRPFVCLSICASSEKAWEQINLRQLARVAVSSYLVCLPPRYKRKSNNSSTIDSRGTALVTKCNIASSPRSTGMAITGG